jgi:hypothetical protein
VRALWTWDAWWIDLSLRKEKRVIAVRTSR